MANNFNKIFYLDLIGIFMIILLTITFFKKSNITKKVAIWFFAIKLVIVPLQINYLYQISPEIAISPDTIRMVGSLFWAIIFLFYFIFSTRVKKTFVKKEDTTVMIVFSLVIPVLLGMSYYSKINEISSKYNLQKTAIKLAEKNLKNNYYNQAEEYFNKAIKLGYSKSKIAIKYQNIANDYWNNKKYYDADIYYIKSIEFGGSTSSVIYIYNNLADKYFDDKNYDKAIKWYKKASDDLNDNGARFRLAYSYSATEQYYKAIEYYEQYLTNNQYEGAMRNLGLIYDIVKKYKKAQQWYKKAFSIYIKKARDGDKKAMEWVSIMYKPEFDRKGGKKER